MKASELRIGNYIQDNLEDIFNVEGITETGICIGGFGHTEIQGMKGLMSLSIDNFKPIPLTEEWLEKFGFGGIEGRRVKGSFILRNYHGNYVYLDDMIDEIKIDSVHKLQNLYFVLTGEEL